MVKYINVESSVKKESYWTDKLHVYILLRQEEKIDNENTIYISDYIKYTKDEFNEVVANKFKDEIVQSMDKSIENVRNNKILESKTLLEKYYLEHPLFSTVHKEEGEYYSVTSEKQSYLMSMLSLIEQAHQIGVEFTPTWNATGEPCEEWTETELRQLSLQIATFVYSAVKKQQYFENQIKELTSVEEIEALVIDYED